MSGEELVGFIPLLLVVAFGAILIRAVRRRSKRQPEANLPPLSSPIAEYTGPLAFFRRHYNGDYSLGRSYWLNSFLLSLFAPIIGLLLLPWLAEHFAARYSSAGFLLITTLGLLAWVWAIAGTWSSANKHVGRGGKQGWATAAKVMIVLGVLRMIGELNTLAPVIEEHGRIALGGQLGPRTKLELRADGRSILLSGGINDGSAEQLRSALAMAPAITTVVLTSEGGWIREGLLLAKVIRERRLNTYVERVCVSACTIAFLAGSERVAEPNARIGFHAFRGVGSQRNDMSPEEANQLRMVYRAAGLEESTIRRIAETPHDEVWFPSHDELLAAGVITRTSLGGETAAIATAVKSKQVLSADLKKTDVFAALSERFPDEFDKVVTRAWQEMQRGHSDAEVITAARAQVFEFLPKLLPLASDQTLVAYSALLQEQLEALSGRNDEICVELVFPTGRPVMPAGALPKALVERELVLLTKIFREADFSRAIKPRQQAVERIAGKALAGMTSEQIEVFADEEVRQRRPRVACTAALAFIRNLNAIHMSERGQALRILYSTN